MLFKVRDKFYDDIDKYLKAIETNFLSELVSTTETKFKISLIFPNYNIDYDIIYKLMSGNSY